MQLQTSKIEDLDFIIPVALEKSERNKSDEEYPIRFGISSNAIDRQQERMVTDSIFDQKTIDYHMKEGYVDYDHLSFRGENAFEKAQAFLGKPYDFNWEQRGAERVPCVEANLFRGNPYVDKVLIPAFEQGNGVFGMSIGGRTISKSKPKRDPESGNKVVEIYKIQWIHDAITPLYKAVNPDTFVSKLHKSLEAICHGATCKCDFEDLQVIRSFDGLIVKSDSNNATTEKALTAQEGNTDYVTQTGGGALQPQSLEGDMVKLLRSMLDSAVVEIKMGTLPKKLDVIIDWFVERGIQGDVAKRYGQQVFDAYSTIKSTPLGL